MHEPIITRGKKVVNVSIGGAFANPWHKRINSNLAYALLVSVMWHIALIPSYLSELELIPLYTLWLFMGLILVPARALDRRWQMLDLGEYSGLELQKQFRFDQASIWLAAFLLPYMWVQAWA